MKPYTHRLPDSQYHNLLKKILEEGRELDTIHTQTQGVRSRKITGWQFDFPLENGFPLMTIRDLSGNFLQGAIGELAAFLNGAQTLEEMRAFGCGWWERWVTEEQCALFGLPEGDLGPGSYGAAWTRFPMPNGEFVNQIRSVLMQIIEKPYLRTHLINPWIPGYTLQSSLDNRQVVVAPCHGWIHFHVCKESKELEVVHWQRSADVPVGLVFNIIQYAVLGMLVAQITGYNMVRLVHQISDAHIYGNQLEKVAELLKRNPVAFPTLQINPELTDPEDIFKFRASDVVISDYNPHPSMRIPTPI